MCTQAELTETTALLAAVNAAILQVMSGGQTYSLDSGQTRVSVTRSTLGELRKMRSELRIEKLQLDDCLNSRGSGFVARPSF